MQDEGLPESDAGKEYALNLMAQSGELDVNKYAGTGRPNELLMKLVERRSQPYYKVGAGYGCWCWFWSAEGGQRRESGCWCWF